MRSFIAIDLSDELRGEVAGIQKEFQFLKGVKPVKPEQAHLTLKFLGEVPEGRVNALKRALDGVRAASFELRLRGVGVFPNTRRIRVIWVGVEDSAALNTLHAEIEAKLEKLGFKREPLSPHVTLFRVKSISGGEKELALKKLEELSDKDFGGMHVSEVKLKKSTLTPKGPIYEDVHVKTLGREG
ncbi:RNA 2',3'-cyclic phosphodiesterase [Candidatus Alkanophaga liquidiphilum]|nr:MAG: RNA 2',3'-cyclic phosphodiesterase [Candidatus Alkanophagales archaeon]